MTSSDPELDPSEQFTDPSPQQPVSDLVDEVFDDDSPKTVEDVSLEGGPRISDHARDRWHERCPCWSVDIETAYEHSTPIIELKRKAFETGDGLPDRVHIFGEHNGRDSYIMVFMIREQVVTTVINIENLYVASSPAIAYLRAVADQQGYTLPKEQRSPRQQSMNPE